LIRANSPRREIASDSTVLAGRTSVSITTGETPDSMTMMSGRLLLPTSIAVFSELTTFIVLQARLVFLKRVAIASLIVCSVVAIQVRSEQLRPLLYLLQEL